MKRSGLSPVIPSATLFLAMAAGIGTSAALGAQENTMVPEKGAPSASPAAKNARRAADLLKRFDQNGDGKLDDDERAAAKEAVMKEQLDFQMARAASVPGGAEAFRIRMIEMFDKDKDGRLNDEERASAQKFAGERGFNGNGELRDELIRRFDINANGRIDEDERAALQEFVKRRMAQGLGSMGGERTALLALLRSAIQADAAQLRRFDTDQDGRLNDAEWEVARKTIVGVLHESPELKPMKADEQRRMEAVAAEVARRRKVREEATMDPEKKNKPGNP